MALTTLGLLAPDARLRIDTADGAIAPGAKLYTYQAGSSTTQQATYSERTLTTPNTNPVVADSSGLMPPIYLQFGVAYNFVLKDENDNVIWSQDYVSIGGVQQNQFNVISYGAVGNGVANDTAAIQAAITAAQNAGGGVVYFPIGTYRITAQLTVTASNIQLIGESRSGSKIVVDDNMINGVIKVQPTNFGTTVISNLASNAAIGDFVVSLSPGEGAKHAAGEYVLLNDSDANNGALITQIESIATDDVTLRDAMTTPLTTANTAKLTGWAGGPMTGFQMRSLTLKCTSDAPTNIQTLLWIVLCKAASVTDCTFSGATGALVLLQSCQDSTVTNCEVENGPGSNNAGINFTTGSCGCGMVNCAARYTEFGFTTSQAPKTRIVGCVVHQRLHNNPQLGRGIKLQSGSNFSTVSGNVISDYRLYGIYLQDDCFCSVTGNAVFRQGLDSDPGEHGIQIGGFEAAACHHNVISGNVIRQATGYGISIAPTAVAAQDLYNVIVGNNISKCTQGGIIVFAANYNTIEGNFISAPTAGLLEAAIVWVGGGTAPASRYNHIRGNTIVTEDSAVVGIDTSASGGLNMVQGNFLGPTVTQKIAVADALAMPAQRVDGIISTGANTNETTAADFTIPAYTLVQPNAGFLLYSRWSFAANGNNKTVKVYLGTASQARTVAVNGETGYMYLWGVVISSTHVLVGGWLTTTSGTTINLFGEFFISSTDDWKTDLHIKITMQNGTASAGDISMSEAYFVPLATAQPVYAA